MPPPGQKSVVRVGTQRIAVAQERAGRPVALRNSVDVRRGELVDRPVSYVCELQGSFFREAALHGEIPLQRIRSCVGRIKSATRRHGGSRELASRERRSIQSAGITACIQCEGSIARQGVDGRAIALVELTEARPYGSVSVPEQVVSE